MKDFLPREAEKSKTSTLFTLNNSEYFLHLKYVTLIKSILVEICTDAKIFILKQETPQFYQPSSSFVVTEVDSIHSQQTCTKNYNQTVATFSQTYWPVTAAAIHIILLASNKQVGSVQDTLDV